MNTNKSNINLINTLRKKQISLNKEAEIKLKIMIALKSIMNDDNDSI